MKRKRTGKKVPKVFDQEKEVRAIARERVGTVKASRVITPKALKKPKYKKPPGEENGPS
jgi:hypothetical protein